MKYVLILAVVSCLILFNSMRIKEKKQREDFKKLNLPPLIDFMKKNSMDLWLGEHQIHVMWHKPNGYEDMKKSMKYKWITREELKKLEKGRFVEKRFIKSFEGHIMIEYQLTSVSDIKSCVLT